MGIESSGRQPLVPDGYEVDRTVSWSDFSHGCSVETTKAGDRFPLLGADGQLVVVELLDTCEIAAAPRGIRCKTLHVHDAAGQYRHSWSGVDQSDQSERLRNLGVDLEAVVLLKKAA